MKAFFKELFLRVVVRPLREGLSHLFAGVLVLVSWAVSTAVLVTLLTLLFPRWEMAGPLGGLLGLFWFRHWFDDGETAFKPKKGKTMEHEKRGE